MSLRRRAWLPSLRRLLLLAALGVLLAAGCSRDPEPVRGGAAGADTSLFRNLGKR